MGSYIGTNGADNVASNLWPNVFGFDGADTFGIIHTFNTYPFIVAVYGGAGADTISVSGGTVNAYIDGGSDNDILNGGANDDVFIDGSGNDQVAGGGGNDTAYLPYFFGLNGGYVSSGSAGNLTLSGFNGTDSYSSIETFVFADGTTRTAAQVLASGLNSTDTIGQTTATTGTILAVAPVSGTIDSAGDQDWYAAILGAGINYTIVEYGYSLDDSLLRLFDPAGNLISSNDDGGGNLNSLLTFTPATSGTYFLSAGAFGSNRGSYELGIFYDTGVSLFDANSNYVNLTIPGGNWDAGAGSDTVIGTAQADRILGGDGFDNLYGGAGNDVLLGGALEDILVGDAGNDVLEGGDGGDVLSELYDPVNSGDDLFYGGNGIDIMYSAGGNDYVYGGFDAANNYGNLGDGDDNYFGSGGTDVVEGGAGNDTIYGNAGDDSMYGDAGNDIIFGGTGIDLLSGAVGNDELYGGGDNDLLVGDAGNDVLDGGAGIDVLYGGADADTLRGGAGTDGLYGGAGADTFQVGGTGYGLDYVWDFQVGVDRLVFQSGHFSQIPVEPGFDHHGLMDGFSFAGGNSTFNVYAATATPGAGAVTYTLTATVVVVGVDMSAHLGDISINGAF